jgi:pyruvate dehydrogenase E1 component alpha subunit
MTTQLKEQQITLFEKMVLIRRFEEKVKYLYSEGTIVGAIHLYIGQEATAVGVCQSLGVQDYVFSTHRGHGHAIAKGGNLKKIMAELMGRDTGLSRGHGGSMHLFEKERGLMGGNGIVGGGIPLALGAAFTSQYREDKRVAVTFFSDGAANQGVFGECLNLSALWKLPVLFICENNHYAATTPVDASFARQNIVERAVAYGVPARSVDGNDITGVCNASAEAAAYVRSGKGPFFIESKTYRIEPHCGIIPDQRKKGEIESWREYDPIARFQDELEKAGVLGTEDIAAIEMQVKSEIDDAVEYGLSSGWPDINADHNKNCTI